MSYWEIINYEPCFSSTSLIIHEQKTKKILPKHWFGFLYRFLRTLDFSWISVRKDSPKYFFFQLLTATSENSSTRLEKRLENSKSAKFESDLLKKKLKYNPAKWRNFTEVCMLRGTFHGMWNSSEGLFTWRWGPQIGEVTCGGSPHLSCKRDQIKMRDYMDRWITHQSRLPHLPGVTQLLVIRP